MWMVLLYYFHLHHPYPQKIVVEEEKLASFNSFGSRNNTKSMSNFVNTTSSFLRTKLFFFRGGKYLWYDNEWWETRINRIDKHQFYYSAGILRIFNIIESLHRKNTIRVKVRLIKNKVQTSWLSYNQWCHHYRTTWKQQQQQQQQEQEFIFRVVVVVVVVVIVIVIVIE